MPDLPRLLAVVALVASLCVAGCSSSPEDDEPPLYPVGEFRLTERSGRSVGRDDLLGKVWVAAFFFTRCGTSCPKVSDTMSRLQKDLAGQKDVLLVSFSVDPEHDCCDVLRDYATGFGADPERWLFLTGKQQEVYDLVQNSFRLSVRQNEGKERTPGNEVMHRSTLVLVDRRGQVRGYFEGVPEKPTPEDQQRYEESQQKLRRRIASLLRERP